MWKLALKTAGTTTAAIFFTGTAYANDGPVEILLSHVNLDLSNPEANSKRIIDKSFKSNDPSIKSRIYVLNDGTRVKLVGRNFDKTDKIDKVKITYPRDEAAYKTSYAALAENFGTPSAKRPDILVWRLDNAPKTSTQSDYVKVIATINENEKRTITANRQRGSTGNNTRRNKPKVTSAPAAAPSRSTLRSAERD